MVVSYSNIKFISRKGDCYDTEFMGTVDITTKTGILWFKKEVIETIKIYSGWDSNFKFLSDGKFTPIEVDRLISVYNATCNRDERLKY